MELIYTDEAGKEIGVLRDYSLDVDIGKENDFELIAPASIPITEGCWIFCYGTEYGGIIRKVKTDTSSEDIVFGGYTWRGMLAKKVIRPVAGQDHRIVSGIVSTILNGFLAETGLNGLFVCETSSVSVSNYQFPRYCTLLEGMDSLLKTKGCRLDLKYQADGKVHIRITEILDHSDELEFSQDCKIQLIIERDTGSVNHLVCLGKGELKDRQVLDLYADANGNVSKTQTLFGADEIVEVYDYSSSEDLEKDGTKKLKEMMCEKAQLSISDADVALYDVVGARDYRSGTYIKREITQKIIRVKQGTETIEYKVGE